MLASQGRAGTESELRKLLTGDDSRGWHAVGRLNFGTVSFCTGALIAPDMVLTAAHCMYDPTTGQRIPDAEIEFLADWRGGRAAAYRGVRRSVVHPDYTALGDDYIRRVSYDLALLQLDQPIRNGSIRPFSMHPHPRAGDEVGVVSYAFDRADSPSLQEVCHILEAHGASLIMSCEVDFGSSGAPVFVLQGGEAQIVSVVSAKAELRGEPVSLGMTLEKPMADLLALVESNDGVFDRPKPVVRRLTLEATQGSTGAKFVRP
nr:trypsin-like serine protease [Pseudoruegeria sp. HB172150]